MYIDVLPEICCNKPIQYTPSGNLLEKPKTSKWKEEWVCANNIPVRRFVEYFIATGLPTGNIVYYSETGIAISAPTSYTLGLCGSSTGSLDNDNTLVQIDW